MKKHDNYSLLGGLQMTKITRSKRKNIKPHSTTTPLFKENKEQTAQEDAARLYRESVMDSTQIVRPEELH
jgi:hypothetical protein